MRVTIVFAKKRGWWNLVSKAIMAAENIKYSHCAIVLENDGYSEVYEARMPNSRTVRLDQWIEEYDLIHAYGFEVESIKEQDNVRKYLKAMMKVKYGWEQLLVIGLQLALVPFRKLTKRAVINGKRKLICTELVGLFCKKFLGIKWKKNPDLLSLKEVHLGVRKALL